MTSTSDAAARLTATLKAVAGLRFYKLGATVDRAGVVVGMPRIKFETYAPGTATSAEFPVFLVVPFDEQAQAKLWEFVEPVAAALESIADTTVSAADPTIYTSGKADLPAYSFTAEMSLS